MFLILYYFTNILKFYIVTAQVPLNIFKKEILQRTVNFRCKNF